MNDSGSGDSKVFGRFTEQAHRILDLARGEAERAGHRYLGPEHVLLGLLAEGHSEAAGLLRATGVDLAAARSALARLAERGVVPAPRPSDGELLRSMGIDLEAVRHETEQDVRLSGGGASDLAGHPPTLVAGRTGGVDAAVWSAVCRQAGLAAGQRTGTCPGPR